MVFSTCLAKRNHEVRLLISVKKRSVKENIYSLITHKIVCQEERQYPSLQQAVESYYNKISKFEHLGYEMPISAYKGKVILLDKDMNSGIL